VVIQHKKVYASFCRLMRGGERFLDEWFCFVFLFSFSFSFFHFPAEERVPFLFWYRHDRRLFLGEYCRTRPPFKAGRAAAAERNILLVITCTRQMSQKRMP
jgi:hypothetical protein